MLKILLKELTNMASNGRFNNIQEEMVGFAYLNLSKRRHKGPGTLIILEEGINLFVYPVSCLW